MNILDINGNNYRHNASHPESLVIFQMKHPAINGRITKRWRTNVILPAGLMLFLSLISCTVISSDVRSQSQPDITFKLLLENPEQYTGETVILGGYILETMNNANAATIKVLQSPLGAGEEPKSRDDSEGRFMVSHPDFLDPEVYKKDRVITVAGMVLGTVEEKIGESRITYLKLESRELYLWPDYPKRAPYYHYYDPWYYYPYYWHRPYQRRYY